MVTGRIAWDGSPGQEPGCKGVGVLVKEVQRCTNELALDSKEGGTNQPPLRQKEMFKAPITM